MLEGRFLAHALRTYNRTVQEPSKHISITTILMDIINFENGITEERQSVLEKKLMMLRCAAQNHLTLMLSVNDFLIEVKKEMRSMNNFPDRGVTMEPIYRWRRMADEIEAAQQQMVETFKMQLPSDIVIGCGFNVAQAEEGFYKHVKKRHDTQSRMRDFATSLSDEQSGGMLNASQCEILTFGDGRNPTELIDHSHRFFPEWTEERQVAEIQAKDEEKRKQEEERNARRAEEERRKAAEHCSQPSTGPAPKQKAMPSRKPPTPKGKDWVRLTLGPMASVVPKEGIDYNGAPVRCEVLMNGNYFVAFTMEGVVAGQAMKRKVWPQYLRRITHYSSLVFGAASNATLPEMDNASDEEWLHLYTHNFNMTSVRRSHCFLSPEAMMIRIDLCDIPETSRDIPALVRQLRCQFGTAIIEDPSAPDADQALCGQIRAASTVLITDMMYHTRSNQKRTNNLESGLQNAMGNPDLKVFQPPWDHMWDADYTVGAFKEGLDYVKAAIASGKNPFVIIWLGFTCMVREGTQPLTGEASFAEDLIKTMKEISKVCRELQSLCRCWVMQPFMDRKPICKAPPVECTMNSIRVEFSVYSTA